MYNDFTNFKIQKDEEKDLQLCQLAFQNNSQHRKVELLPTPFGTHYDAKFYREDINKKMQLEYYIEIKRRKCTEDKYNTGIFKVEKENFLLEVQEQEKIPIKVIVFYPKNGSWYYYDINEIKDCPKDKRWLKKVENDPNSERVLTDVYLLPLNKERRMVIGVEPKLLLPFIPLEDD